MTQEKLELYKKRIIKIIEIFFPQAKIYLFGSRARGDYDERSDFDIAIDAGEKISLVERGQIMSMIDALNIPQYVDMVDFNAVAQDMKDRIIKEKIVWKN